MLFFTLLMTALVVLLLWCLRSERRRLEWVFKPAAAATFVAAGLWAGAANSTFGRVLLAGLLLAAAGDVLLIPKHRAAFLGGLVAFLLGHVAYAIAFVIAGVSAGPSALAGVVLALVALPVLRWLWPHVEGPMRGPVVAYVIVITAMVALAVGATARTGAPLLLVGALMFYLSDLSVARDRFVKTSFGNRLWGLPLYFYAQLVLASQAALR